MSSPDPVERRGEANYALGQVRSALEDQGFTVRDASMVEASPTGGDGPIRILVLVVEPETGTQAPPGNGLAELVLIGEAHVDFRRRRVMRGHTIVSLTPSEADLLTLLVRERGRTISRQRLFHELWDGREVGSGALDTAVFRVRRKIEPVPERPRWILSVRGLGFRLEEEEGRPKRLPAIAPELRP